MKSLKRLLVLFVAVAMMMTMCLPMVAKAAPVGTNADTGKITVKGVETGVTVKAYPIVTAKYDDNGNFDGYNDNGYTINKDKGGNYTPTPNDIAEITEKVKYDNVAAIDLEESTDTDGKVIYTKDGQKPGMYLVLVTNTATSTVYNPAVVSISYGVTKDADGKTLENVLNPGNVDLGGVYDGTTTLKKSTAPGVDKKITGIKNDKTNVTEDGKGSSANIGDTVSYKVEINPIPSYTGKYPVLNVEDTLSKGLEYVEGSLKLYVADAEATNLEKATTLDSSKYVAEFPTKADSKKMKIDFVVDKVYQLNGTEYKGKKIVITYDAVLTKDAEANTGDNNKVVLNYTKDSTVNKGEKTDEKKTYTYTFDIDGNLTNEVVTKVDDDGTTALAGAEFALYTDAEGTNVYKNKTGENGAEKAYSNIVSDANGKLHVTGLSEGKYYLKEKKAPEGYTLNTTVYEIEISAHYKETGELDTWNYTIKVAGTDNKVGDITFNHEKKVSGTGTTIKNTKLSTLPSTGGMGTYIFTIVGVVIMVVAAGFLFLRRKESK